MRGHRLIAMFSLAALAAAALCVAEDSFDPEKVWASRATENVRLLRELDSLEPTRFYRLDGGPANKRMANSLGSFHDVPVLAAGVPGETSLRKEFKSSLRRVLKSSNGAQSACFYPRHGVTLGDGTQQYDIVLCFECNAFLVYGVDGEVLYMSGFDGDKEAARWDEAFSAAGAVTPSREFSGAPP